MRLRRAATYVAIIMDGNARWATERGLPILEGHRAGAKTLKQTVKDAVRSASASSPSTPSRPRTGRAPSDEVAG